MTCPHGRESGTLCPHCYPLQGVAIVRVSQDCPECRKVTSGDCGRHGPIIVTPVGRPAEEVAADLQRMREERDSYRERAVQAERERAEVGMRLDAIAAILRGEEVSDFAESFVNVRGVLDLRRERDLAVARAEKAEADAAALREVLNKALPDTPLREVAEAARVFARHPCECETTWEGRGPKCASCVLRDALARLDALTNAGGRESSR